MEWIDGEPINDYIARNLKHPAALRSLSSRWSDLIGSLRKAQIAHGDLQHGNILVTGGDLKLIDYDAMYVPALAGMASHEEGHRNYQHPGRTGRDYHADLDNFSAWVILASINALTLVPDLWDRLEAGDECLLFRDRDFIAPETSKLFRYADQCPDRHVREVLSTLRTFLSLPVARVPALDRARLDGDPPPNRPSGYDGRTTGQGLPEWLRDRVPHTDHASQHQDTRKHQPLAPPGQPDLIVTPRLGVAGYGLRFKKADVKKYFDERWTSVTLVLDGVAHEFKLYNKFRSSNPAIRGEPIEEWLSKRRMLPLDKDDPPKLIVRIVGKARFQLI